VCDAVNLSYLERHQSLLAGARQVLEVGSFNVNGNSKRFFVERGADYTGIDLRPGPDVDLVCDITDDGGRVAVALGFRSFDVVVCMNVLEHVYHPHVALDNVASLVRPGGRIVVVTPAVWDLHDWPHDFLRLNPDFFREFARRSKLRIVDGTFEYSIRDSGAFVSDLSALPQVVPHLHGSVAARIARRVVAAFFPEAADCWPRTYLNLILERPAANVL
jgi:SAM-dependent methyltransferase